VVLLFNLVAVAAIAYASVVCFVDMPTLAPKVKFTKAEVPTVEIFILEQVWFALRPVR
jgi:hypothetical protein